MRGALPRTRRQAHKRKDKLTYVVPQKGTVARAMRGGAAAGGIVIDGSAHLVCQAEKLSARRSARAS